MLNTIILGYARDMLTVIALVGVMVWRDVYLTLAILVGGPIIFTMIAGYTRRIRRIARSEVEINAQVIAGMQEVAHGIEIVKSFTMEEQLKSKMVKLIRQAQEQSYKIARITARTSPMMEFLMGIALAGIIVYGNYVIKGGNYDTGTLTSFIAAMLLAYEPAKRLANIRVQLERSFVNTRMIYEILDTPQSNRYQKNGGGNGVLKVKKGEVVFEGVDFYYESKEQKIIDGLNFKAEAGENIGIGGTFRGGENDYYCFVATVL